MKHDRAETFLPRQPANANKCHHLQLASKTLDVWEAERCWFALYAETGNDRLVRYNQ